MNKFPGVYDDKGYTAIRIWLGPKRNRDGSLNPPYRRTLGAWNNANFQRAKNHVDEVRKNYKKGILPGQAPEPIPFPAVCDIYKKRHWTDKAGRSTGSIRNVGYGLQRFKETWRARAFHSILPSDIDTYVADRTKAGIKVSTINRELALLSSIFSMTEHWNNRREIGPYLLPTNVHGIPYNPVLCVEKASTVAFKRERIATDAEILKVKIYCDNKDPDMLEIIKRSIFTGLRKSDLEKVNGLADVRGILSKSREKKLFKFPLDFSQKLKYQNFARRWDSLREACGMEDFHWHDWRHTSGTMLSILGFSDEDIQAFYGHSSIQQTRDYINRGKERLKPHVDALEGHLKKLWKDAPAPLILDATKKRCRGCNEIKPLTAFGRHAAFKNGLNSQCKACNYARLKEQRRLNPNIRANEYLHRSGNSIATPGVGNSVGKGIPEPKLVNVS